MLPTDGRSKKAKRHSVFMNEPSKAIAVLAFALLRFAFGNHLIADCRVDALLRRFWYDGTSIYLAVNLNPFRNCTAEERLSCLSDF